MGRSKLSALALLALAASGRAADSPARPARPPIQSDRHLRYQPIESEEARALLDRALDYGKKHLGAPAIPLKKVQLRRSVPREGEGAIIRDFQLTEITDSTEGVFTIYLSARPGEVAFSGQLAHEAFHLFNARLRDAYVEGLNVLLAEELLRELGQPWDPWLRHFQFGKDPLYGAAYFLARELAEAAGREPLLRLLSFAVESPGDPTRMEIDIDCWLDSIEAPARARAEAVIARRYPAVEVARKKDQPELAFRRPRPH